MSDDMDVLATNIIAAMRYYNYRVDTAPGQCNIVYVEGMGPNGVANDNAPNKFNDARFVIKFKGDVPFVAGAWDATTEPGKYWTEHPMNPKGAARIQFGQYTAWQVGHHHNDPNHEALVQTGGPVTVCRDLNKDYDREGDKTDTGLFGINQHRAYGEPKDDLRRSSAGCLVGWARAGHEQFMALVKTDPRYVADHRFIFTTTILAAADVVEDETEVA